MMTDLTFLDVVKDSFYKTLRYQFARTNNWDIEKISCEFSFPTGEFKRFEHFSDFDQLQTEVS